MRGPHLGWALMHAAGSRVSLHSCVSWASIRGCLAVWRRCLLFGWEHGEGTLYRPLGSGVKADGLSLDGSEVLPERRRAGWPLWLRRWPLQGCLLASPPRCENMSFIQSRLLWEKALYVLRCQELCLSQPAATFAHLAWVLQSGSSRPSAPSKCQFCCVHRNTSRWAQGPHSF